MRETKGKRVKEGKEKNRKKKEGHQGKMETEKMWENDGRKEGD